MKINIAKCTIMYHNRLNTYLLFNYKRVIESELVSFKQNNKLF